MTITLKSARFTMRNKTRSPLLFAPTCDIQNGFITHAYDYKTATSNTLPSQEQRNTFACRRTPLPPQHPPSSHDDQPPPSPSHVRYLVNHHPYAHPSSTHFEHVRMSPDHISLHCLSLRVCECPLQHMHGRLHTSPAPSLLPTRSGHNFTTRFCSFCNSCIHRGRGTPASSCLA